MPISQKLESFLNHIVMHPELEKSKCLASFLDGEIDLKTGEKMKAAEAGMSPGAVVATTPGGEAEPVAPWMKKEKSKGGSVEGEGGAAECGEGTDANEQVGAAEDAGDAEEATKAKQLGVKLRNVGSVFSGGAKAISAAAQKMNDAAENFGRHRESTHEDDARFELIKDNVQVGSSHLTKPYPLSTYTNISTTRIAESQTSDPLTHPSARCQRPGA